MSRRAHPIAWLPPLLVGAAAAAAAEVAVGILLYAGPGLMRSLTTVLTVELAALAAGVWSAPGAGPDVVDRLRKHWLLCMLAFLAAAVFGTSWTVIQEMGSTAVTQGLGLAVMAALPLYACGGVLGGMSTIAVEDRGGPLPGPGAPAALGGAIGFAATGWMLPRSILPSSLLIASLVALSLGGVLYGVVLSRRKLVVVRGSLPSALGEVRVEDSGGSAWPATRTLVEAGHVRRTVGMNGDERAAWDLSLGRVLLPPPEREWRVLHVGGGASITARALVREHPAVRVDVLERGEAVVALAREHLETDLSVGGSERASVRVGNLDDLIEETHERYDLVLVDTDALAPLGGVAGLSARSRRGLLDRVAPGGVVAWGGALAGEVEAPDADWSVEAFARPGEAARPEIVVFRWPGVGPLPEAPSGFIRRAGGDVAGT